MGSKIKKVRKKGPKGNEDKGGKVPHSTCPPSPVDSSHRDAYNSISGTNTAQSPEAPFWSAQEDGNLLTKNINIRGRSSNGAATAFAPDFGGGDVAIYNPRSAASVQWELPPLSGVLDVIATDAKNHGFPCIEYPVTENTQYLNNMSRRFPPFVGEMGSTRSQGISIPPPDPRVFRYGNHTGLTKLPRLYAVLDDIANDLENRVGGFPPIEYAVNSTSEYLLNMVGAFPAISPDHFPGICNAHNDASSTGSNCAVMPSSARNSREPFTIHSRTMTPELSNSLLNQPLEKGNSVDNPLKTEQCDESLINEERD
ncbi:hypothetical protein I7I51_08929 [Histoplasma capsulatum]|uniref:Uncharacterized protein n=2 Tax=Histoplasma TaxID=5036 RepID=A0A8A1M4B0_AJECA|nr:hypothetical protein I7I51_08929 [Histoplasma capsulatum]